MNWQKVSIERLRAYPARKNALEIIPEQIKTLEMSFTSIRSATTDGTAVSGGEGNKRETALIDNIVMRDELAQNLKIAEREVAITEKGLAGLTDEQQTIISMFYIERPRGHVDLLCEKLYLEKSRVYALKEDALKKFTIACYGIVEI